MKLHRFIRGPASTRGLRPSGWEKPICLAVLVLFPALDAALGRAATVDLVQLPSSVHDFSQSQVDRQRVTAEYPGPSSMDGNFATKQGYDYAGGDGAGWCTTIAEHTFIEPRAVRTLKYRLAASARWSGHYDRDGEADFVVQYSLDGNGWENVPGSFWQNGGGGDASVANDSGVVSVDVNLEGVRKVRARAHSQARATGGEGSFGGGSHIYELQAWGIVPPATIAAEPQSQRVRAGEPARFEVRAAGGSTWNPSTPSSGRWPKPTLPGTAPCPGRSSPSYAASMRKPSPTCPTASGTSTTPPGRATGSRAPTGCPPPSGPA